MDDDLTVRIERLARLRARGEHHSACRYAGQIMNDYDLSRDDIEIRAKIAHYTEQARESQKYKNERDD